MLWSRSQVVASIRLALLSVCLCLLSGCELGSGVNSQIDADWHKRSLIEGHLSRWLAAAPTPSGLFQTEFDRNWTTIQSTSGDLTTQSRLIYAMLAGYELTSDKSYRDEAVKGADFLINHFHDPVHGGYFARVTADGKVISDAKQTYANAFALFALANMFRVTKEEKYRLAAMKAWRDIKFNLRDANGGFRPETSRDFRPSASLRTQNPVMHLFEALLALADATHDPEALAGADSVARFVVYRLLQGLPDGSAYIPEWYDEQWRPLADKEKGGYVDIGHQFEWSHLLLGSAKLGLSGIYSETAKRVLSYAVKVGYEEIDGGSFSRAYPDGTVDRDKLWWQQSECLWAMMAGAKADNRSDLWRRYEQTLELVRSQFIDPKGGGWAFGSKQYCTHNTCPDRQLEPYHMTAMHLAAIRFATVEK